MSDTLDPLIADLIGWCAREPRRYADVLDAWRTSCPRLMVWEEAVARGLVVTRPGSHGLVVDVTESGLALIGGAIRIDRVRPPEPAVARA